VIEMPISPMCEKILKEREHVLIGISPFNSYYSEENIEKLVIWGHTRFKNFHVFVPDTLPYSNFLAIGYPHNKALTKTKRQARYLLNKVNRVLLKLTSSTITDDKIITISKVSQNMAYCGLYNACLEKYTHDMDFKKTCQAASSMLLKSYTSNVTEQMLDVASKYLLGELPFYIDTPGILGVKTSLFVYHESIDFFVNLYANRRQYFVVDIQGHLVLKMNTER
jgi:cyclo(L-tyrosyl-L-tyrosyl) synthase